MQRLSGNLEQKMTRPTGPWRDVALETCRGSPPLSIVATRETPSPSALPGGSIACLFMQLELDDGPWLGGAPLVLGSRGQPSRLLI